jgi:hypothetical protein
MSTAPENTPALNPFTQSARACSAKSVVASCVRVAFRVRVGLAVISNMRPDPPDSIINRISCHPAYTRSSTVTTAVQLLVSSTTDSKSTPCVIRKRPSNHSRSFRAGCFREAGGETTFSSRNARIARRSFELIAASNSVIFCLIESGAAAWVFLSIDLLSLRRAPEQDHIK